MIAYYVSVDDEVLARLVAGEEPIEDYLTEAIEAEDRSFDIDKAWAGIHYLLCGKVWEGEGPLFDAVLGGEALGEEDLGRGPPRILRKEAVAAVSAALGGLDLEPSRGRFMAEVLHNEEIYPGFTEAEDFNYLEYYFEALKGFFAECARNGRNLVLFIA
jgi:hypothetical protein